MLHDIEESIGGDGFEDEQIQASSVEGRDQVHYPDQRRTCQLRNRMTSHARVSSNDVIYIT